MSARAREGGLAGEPCFRVYSAFEPLARLATREGTLEGAVPLRVAQACVPLLEGNALGVQVVLAHRLVVRSRLGRVGIAATEAIDRAHRAAVPLLATRGLLRRAWQERLAKSWWWTERGRLRVWTGLLVQPRAGTWLRVTGAGNRKSLAVNVHDTWIGDFDAPVPLVLDLDAAGGARLEGELATIAVVSPAVRAEIVSLDDAPELAEAHAAFYDARYFATKKGEITRKYRRAITLSRSLRSLAPVAKGSDEAEADAVVRVAHLAGPRPEIVDVDRVLGPTQPSPVAAPRGQHLDVVRFANAVPFRAHYDGHTLEIEPERDVLARGARDVEAALGSALGEGFVPLHKGAVLYLTKYFTPHPRGEPHFFVKPWAFTETPRGWSSIVDGARGDGYDVMRGVVWTDRFHATPAVFQLQPLKRITVPLGAPLVDAIAIPRALASESFEEERFE